MTFVSLIYIIFAILGLSFLIFIHELGHYFMARRLGMRVETFSIGMGHPVYSWKRGDTQWQIGWLLFGGYVKIAGAELSDEKDMYAIKDGFFGQGPLSRIKVAFMGPLVNLVFALLAFTVLWSMGGREKNFSEHTHKIGWVDPKSELYANGMRPGDEIASYNGNPFQGAKDHVLAPMTADGDVEVKGYHVDFRTKEKTPFTYAVKPYTHPSALDKSMLTTGILNSATYITYEKLPNGQENSLPEGSPLQDSGIEYGDRIVWVDGVPVYSVPQMTYVLNDSKALLTVQRGDDVFLRRTPRVLIEELKLDPAFKEELTDWQFEANLNDTKLQQLYTIPYNLNNSGVVESIVRFIDKEKDAEYFPAKAPNPIAAQLEAGDRILAVDGIAVTHAFELLSLLQTRHVNVIIERDETVSAPVSWNAADSLFDKAFKWEDLQRLTSQIGISQAVKQSGNLHLLKSIVPKKRQEFTLSADKQAILKNELEAQQNQIEAIEDPVKRSQLQHLINLQSKQLLIGLPLVQDKKVEYNPGPFELFGKVFSEIWQTLKALVTGSLNLKWMSGPIGIVQVVHDNSMGSIREALYWLGAISLNLGALNLLPLPVLDGGTICFSLFELITGRRLKPKTLERLIVPFAILLIALFIFLTYNDILRLFTGSGH